MTTNWRNWSGQHRATATTRATPVTEVELRHAVGDAVRSGRRIKAVGAGHSFTPIAVADDVLLDLAGWTGLVAHDRERHRVTVRSGTRLWQLSLLLTELGLAMTNLGDIDRQSIAGAIATGTHGTGAEYGSLSSQVVGMTMINGRGEDVVVTDDDPELLNACRVSLGALGIVTDVTLQCEPAFDLSIREEHAPLTELVTDWRQRRTGADHFEFYWFGHSDTVITKSLTREPGPGPAPGARQRVARWASAELLDNATFGLLCEVGRLSPSLVPGLNRLATRAWTPTTRRDRSDQVFTSARRVRFREMEYGFAVDEVPAVLQELRRLFVSGGHRVTFPVEVRVAAAEDAWLSMAYGRATGYVAVHQYVREHPEEYFAAVEELFVAHGGRPHWGKQHTRAAVDLAASYPRLADFVELRDRNDPDRLFANPYLEQVLGS